MNSGNTTTNSNNSTWLKFDWWIVERNVTENYSVIKYVLKTERSKSGYVVGGNTKLIINDSQVHFDSSRRNFYNGTEVASGVHRIYHNEDGKAWINVYMEMAVYSYSVNTTGTLNQQLDDLARKAYFRYEPGNIVDKADGNIDASVMISNPAGLKTLLEIEMLGGQRYFATKDIESNKWYNLLNNDYSRKAEFRKLLYNKSNTDLNWKLTTFANDGSLVGYDLRTGKKAIFEEVKPDFSNYTLIEKNQKVKDLLGYTSNEFIQRQSEIRVSISAENHMKPQKYAEPQNYIVTCGGTAYYSMTKEEASRTQNLIYNKEHLTISGDVDFNVTAEDTRGFRKTVTKKVKIHEYFKPTINATVSRRNNFDEVIQIKVSGRYPEIIGSKPLTMKVYYKKANESTYTYSKTISLNASGGSYNLSNGTEYIYLDQANDYDVKLVLDSYFESTEEVYRINKGKAIFFISSNEEKVYENENLIVGQNIASARATERTISIYGDGESKLRTIPTNKNIVVGDKIEIVNNQTMVRIKKGIKKVRIDAFIATENRPYELWIFLYKNSAKYNQRINTDEDLLIKLRSNIDKWMLHTISGVIVEVKENDILTFEVGKWTNGGTVDLKLTSAYFTVEAIE